MSEVRVITLWQPWALLLASGIKKIETRPSPTSWRGTYLIHAAKFNSLSNRVYFEEFLNSDSSVSTKFKSVFPDIKSFEDLPFGKIVGSFKVEGCRKMVYKNDFDDEINIKDISLDEISMGIYGEGRYAWMGTNFKLLKNPIDYRGGQGYYNRFNGNLDDLLFIEPKTT